MATRLAPASKSFGIRDYVVIAAATTLLTGTLTALSFGSASSTPAEPISPALLIHIGTVVPALPLGAYILISRKGGPRHRLLGRIWAALMVITAISAFWLRSNGSLSYIHIFSVVTLVSIPLSVFYIRKGWVERHKRAMTGVYIGLVVAGAFAFLPGRLLHVWLFG